MFASFRIVQHSTAEFTYGYNSILYNNTAAT